MIHFQSYGPHRVLRLLDANKDFRTSYLSKKINRDDHNYRYAHSFLQALRRGNP